MHWYDRFRVFRYHYKQMKRWQGDKAKSLGWVDEESQLGRFEVIVCATNFDQKSVLDLGCGYGELFELLDSLYRIQFYTGVDQHWSFLKKAKLSYTAPCCRFVVGDMSRMHLDMHDVVIASGSLNYVSRDPDYLSSMISRMYELAHETVIFNLLSSHHYPPRNTLMSYHPQGVYRYCKTLCDDVSLIEGYAEGDFTIVMKKPIPRV